MAVTEDVKVDGSVATEGKKLLTMAEVAKHCTETDCWLAIHGKVYDVTKFMDDHPGGGDVMLNSTGRDATDDFEDIGHSSDAHKMLEEYYIGELDPADAPTRPTATAKKELTPTRRSQSETSIFMLFLQILVPIAIIGLAIAVRFLTAPQEPKSS